MNTEKVTIGNATLYCGDCFSVLPTLDLQADALITDMPYGISDCDWDCSIPLDSFWDMVERKAKPTANFVLFACGRFTHELYNSNRSAPDTEAGSSHGASCQIMFQ